MQRRIKFALLAAGTLIVASSPAWADHAWNNYHWSRTGAQVQVAVGDNVSGEWQTYYEQAVADWNVSGYIEGTKAAGLTNPKNCKPVAGRIEVCNSPYGRTGWLGIAQIWLSSGHITQGVTKLNDTYFRTSTYNTPAWRDLVTCQEIGHDYGLGHQDEDFGNADVVSGGRETCMDYTDRPENNGQPNQHDYDQLDLIYGGHSETNFGVRTPGSTTGQALASEAAGGDTPSEWGRAIGYTADGRPDVFERTIAPGRKMITHVFWAVGEGPKGAAHHHD